MKCLHCGANIPDDQVIRWKMFWQEKSKVP